MTVPSPTTIRVFVMTRSCARTPGPATRPSSTAAAPITNCFVMGGILGQTWLPRTLRKTLHHGGHRGNSGDSTRPAGADASNRSTPQRPRHPQRWRVVLLGVLRSSVVEIVLDSRPYMPAERRPI